LFERSWRWRGKKGRKYLAETSGKRSRGKKAIALMTGRRFLEKKAVIVRGKGNLAISTGGSKERWPNPMEVFVRRTSVESKKND